MKKNPEEPKKGKKLLVGPLLAGGTSAIVAVVATLAARDSRAVLDTLQRFGGPWLIGLVAIFVVSQGFSQVMEAGKEAILAMKESAASQQRLADAVNLIARKDDERARENELVMDYLTRNSKAVLEEIQATRRDLAVHGSRLKTIEDRHNQVDSENVKGEKSRGATASG